MTIGALVIGTVTDVIGRRGALMLSVAIFSIFTLLCAFAPSAEIFGALRFLAGIGLGGCLPTAITRVTEHQAAQGRGASAATFVMTGYHVGAVLTSLPGILLIGPFGRRAMFVAGSPSRFGPRAAAEPLPPRVGGPRTAARGQSGQGRAGGRREPVPRWSAAGHAAVLADHVLRAGAGVRPQRPNRSCSRRSPRRACPRAHRTRSHSPACSHGHRTRSARTRSRTRWRR